jgi:hypothetical protein
MCRKHYDEYIYQKRNSSRPIDYYPCQNKKSILIFLLTASSNSLMYDDWKKIVRKLKENKKQKMYEWQRTCYLSLFSNAKGKKQWRRKKTGEKKYTQVMIYN